MAATKTAPVETPAETPAKKKRGVPAGTVREKKFDSLNVKWEKAVVAQGFDVKGALTALAQNLNLHVAENESKDRESGKGTGKFTLVVSGAPIQKRAKSIIGKDKEKDAIAAFRAALRDPEKAPRLQNLMEANKNGADNSSEIASLIGVAQ